jgi:hypothetical protein
MCIASPPGTLRSLLRSFTTGERCIAGVVPCKGSELNHLHSGQELRRGGGIFPEASGNVPDARDLLNVDSRSREPGSFRDRPQAAHSAASTFLKPSPASPWTARQRVGSHAARDRVLHAGRIEGGLPAPPVVARELEVVALVRHAAFDVADTGRSASMRARFQRDEEQAPEAVNHDCPRLRRH